MRGKRLTLLTISTHIGGHKEQIFWRHELAKDVTF